MSTPSVSASVLSMPSAVTRAGGATGQIAGQVLPVPAAAMAERIAPSAVAARLVPYGFARSGQILVAHQHADGLEVWISERTSDAALAEVARNFGALSVARVPADELA
ncbi:type II secretion system protein GspE, partial [Paraburkholderia agricolaris]